MARRGAPNEDLSNIEFETSEEVEVVPTFNSMVNFYLMFHLYSIADYSNIHCVLHFNRAYGKSFCELFMPMVSVNVRRFTKNRQLFGVLRCLFPIWLQLFYTH